WLRSNPAFIVCGIPFAWFAPIGGTGPRLQKRGGRRCCRPPLRHTVAVLRVGGDHWDSPERRSEARYALAGLPLCGASSVPAIACFASSAVRFMAETVAAPASSTLVSIFLATISSLERRMSELRRSAPDAGANRSAIPA